MFPVADETLKLTGRNYEFGESALRRESTQRSEDFSGELQDESGESQATKITDDAEVRVDFWTSQGDSISRCHNELRFQVYVSREEIFPIHLKYNDVTRSGHTDLDLMQEERIDDYCHVDSNRNLSDSYKDFAKLTLLKEEPPEGQMWFDTRLAKVQTTTRPNHV